MTRHATAPCDGTSSRAGWWEPLLAVLAFTGGAAITLFAQAATSWVLLLGLLLLVDGIIRLILLERTAWSMAALLGGVLVVVVLVIAVGVHTQGQDRPAPHASGGLPAPTVAVGTSTIPPPAVAPPPMSAPRASSPVPTTTPPPPVRYRVRRGDTLSAIADFFGARPQDIIALNGLPPTGAIQAEQELLIPVGR